MTTNMRMLADSICLIQGHLMSIDNRLANLEEALTTPQTSMTDLTTLDFDSGGLDFVSISTAQDHINPSLYPATPSSQSLSSSSSSISPLIDSLPVDQQMEIRGVRQRASNRTSYVRGCMDSFFSKDEMASSNYDGSRNKRKLEGEHWEGIMADGRVLRAL